MAFTGSKQSVGCIPGGQCTLRWSSQGHSRASLVNVTDRLVILLIAAVPETEATRKGGLFWLTVWVCGQLWCWKHCLTAPMVRKQKEMHAGVQLKDPACEMGPFTFRVGLRSSVKSLWTHPHRHTEFCFPDNSKCNHVDCQDGSSHCLCSSLFCMI